MYRTTEKPTFNHTGHKELWEWLARNAGARKQNWPGWEQNGGPYEKEVHLCFACTAAMGYRYIFGPQGHAWVFAREQCIYCPLQWPKNAVGMRTCVWGGLFALWERTKSPEMAAQIRDLPLVEGWNGIVI